MNGSSHVTSAQIRVNGGASMSNNSVVTPAPQTGAGGVSDPLSSLPMPSFSGCDHLNWNSGGGDVTADPGVYCGGISITSSGTVTFNPGLYILNGSGFSVTGSGTIRGAGVTFFNTGQSGYVAGAVSTGGSATLTLSAPNSGTYQGMLFVQDRNLSYSGNNVISGSSTSVVTGTLYFPSTTLSFTGSSSGSYTAIVSKTVTFTGTSSLKNDPTGVLTGLAGRTASLIN